MKRDKTDWSDLQEFRGVDLGRSYVLSWSTESESLLIDVDLYLTPEHPFYEEPRPAEKACFRPALIEFPWCTRVASREDSTAQNFPGAVQSLGNGRISGLRRTGEGRYEVLGEFGTVDIVAERPMVRLKTP
jgi:hypothetical protein